MISDSRAFLSFIGSQSTYWLRRVWPCLLTMRTKDSILKLRWNACYSSLCSSIWGRLPSIVPRGDRRRRRRRLHPSAPQGGGARITRRGEREQKAFHRIFARNQRISLSRNGGGFFSNNNIRERGSPAALGSRRSSGLEEEAKAVP